MSCMLNLCSSFRMDDKIFTRIWNRFWNRQRISKVMKWRKRSIFRNEYAQNLNVNIIINRQFSPTVYVASNVSVAFFNTLRTGDIDLRLYITTVQDGWGKSVFLTRWNSVHLQVLLSATPQGGMFPQVSQPQALLGSLVSISWKFQFTKIVSEFVINF
jgi:hypothetical protein